jgi:ABC-type multidrug transport system permease subunit
MQVQPPLTTPSVPAVSAADSRTSVVIGGILILIGAIFLFVNVLHIDFGQVWPIIFFIIGAGFYLPVLLMPRDRQNLAGLLVPGTILFGLGTIFFYNIFADNWGSWAYIWALIPAAVGLGLLLAARVGHWGGDTMKVGFWMFVISTGVCAILATFFTGGNAGLIGAILLIGLGVVLLIQSIRR